MKWHANCRGTDHGIPIVAIDGSQQMNAVDRSRLVQAAPDLLQACEAALDVLDNMITEEFSIGKDRPVRMKLVEVIQRAKGE